MEAYFKMENLNEFLNKYLKVEEPSEQKHQELKKELAKKKGKNDWSERWTLDRFEERMGGNKFRRMTHSTTNKNLSRNLFDDNIVAYTKDRFMAMVIIRGKKKFFAFVVKDNEIYLGGMQYSLMDTDLNEAVKKIEKWLVEYPEGTKIDKPELWNELKRTILVEAIADAK